MNFLNFKNKVVLITGSGSGIGKAAIIAFAERGAKVVINDISETKGKETLELVKQKGGTGIFIKADVSKESEAKKLIEETIKEFGKLDILVNNAAIVVSGKVENTSLEDFERTMDINVKGPFLLCKYAIPYMKKNGYGVIINMSSVAAIKGVLDRCVYSISKGAMYAFTKSLAIDYIKDNIRVNMICPGTTLSDGIIERTRSTQDPEATMKELIARQPMGRLGKVEEIASAILYAASDDAAFMTGSAIIIDGGATL